MKLDSRLHENWRTLTPPQRSALAWAMERKEPFWPYAPSVREHSYQVTTWKILFEKGFLEKTMICKLTYLYPTEEGRQLFKEMG